jgi:hypothetical protein
LVTPFPEILGLAGSRAIKKNKGFPVSTLGNQSEFWQVKLSEPEDQHLNRKPLF